MSHLLLITDIIFSIFGNILYPLFAVFFQIIDAVQAIFYAFAGLGTLDVGNVRVTGEGGPDTLNSPNSADTRNGIVYYMLRSETIQNIFFSMVILAVFLLVIFTVMAFIKNMYQTKQKKWQDIISSAVKGAISFVFIPVCCLLGVIAGNFLLQALNEATTTSTDTTISRQLFVTSAYYANKFRKDGWTQEDVATLKKDYAIYLAAARKDGTLPDDIETNIKDGVEDGEYYAQFVDIMYRSNNFRSVWYVGDVYEYYNTWNINYLLLGAGGIFMLFALIKISFGMVKRLFMLVLLFVISPVVCSLYPLDDGAAVGSWRKSFTGNFFSAYGAVVGMNLFFCLVPIFNNIDVVAGAGGGGLDWIDIVPLMITICALYMVTDFIKLVQGFIPGGGEDALSAGMGLAGNVKKRLQQGAKKVGSGTRKTVGAFVRAKGYKDMRKEFISEEIQKAKDKKGAPLTADEEKQARLAAREKLGGKAKRNPTTGDIESVRGGSAASGFFRSLGGTIGKGGLDVLGNLTDKMGFGNVVKGSQNVFGGEESAAGRKAAKTFSEGEYGEKKMARAMRSGDINELYGAVKAMEKAGDAGKKGFELALKDPAVQTALKNLGYNDPRKVTLDQYSGVVTAMKKESDLKEKQKQATNVIDKEVADTVKTAGYTSGSNEEKASQMYVRMGGGADAAAKAFKGISSSDAAILKGMMDGLMANADFKAKYDTAASATKVITAQRIEVLKGIDTDNMDSKFSQPIVDKIGQLQDTYDKLDNGAKLAEVGTEVSDAVNDAATKAMENVIQTVVNSGTAVAKAVKDLSKDITKELTKDKKKGS